MDRILFLIKNGIGFGHVRRAILVGEAIQRLEPSTDITIISQAKSLRLFRNVPFKVINFPLLDRLPSNSTEKVYVELLRDVVTRLAPSLVIEDTYPDRRYLSLPPLQTVPKILLLRRVDSYGFERFRRENYFSCYDRIVIGQHKRDFLLENHSRQSQTLVELSKKFIFSGPIFRYPTIEELHLTAKHYEPDLSPLIVVSAGAGGDHFNDAYCERLFSSMSRVASKSQQAGRSARFVFVLGPYYGGVEPPKQSNTTVVRFEPHLTALLHLAHVVVVRPGHNIVYEALSGTASVIVIPSISYMEDQYSFSEYLSKEYGVAIGDNEDVDLLFHLTSNLLDLPRRARNEALIPGQDCVARAVIEEVEQTKELSRQPRRVTSARVFLLLANALPNSLSQTLTRLRETCGTVHFVSSENSGDHFVPDLQVVETSSPPGREGESEFPVVLLRSRSPHCVTPRALRERGVRVILYTDGCEFSMNCEEWLQHHNVRDHGMLECKLFHFYALPNGLMQFYYLVPKLLLTSSILPLYVDLSLLSNQSELTGFVNALADWLLEAGVQLMTIQELVHETALSKLA